MAISPASACLRSHPARVTGYGGDVRRRGIRSSLRCPRRRRQRKGETQMHAGQKGCTQIPASTTLAHPLPTSTPPSACITSDRRASAFPLPVARATAKPTERRHHHDPRTTRTHPPVPGSRTINAPTPLATCSCSRSVIEANCRLVAAVRPRCGQFFLALQRRTRWKRWPPFLFMRRKPLRRFRPTEPHELQRK